MFENLPSTSLERFRDAFLFAEEAHDGQLDKGGEPKICHVVRVGSSLLPDIEAAVVGLLHDVVEDTPASLHQLIHALDLTPAQANAIALVTRKEGEPYADYIHSIATAATPGAQIARLVKLADLRDNLNPRRQAQAEGRAGAGVMVPKRLAYLAAVDVLCAGLGSEGNPPLHPFRG